MQVFRVHPKGRVVFVGGNQHELVGQRTKIPYAVIGQVGVVVVDSVEGEATSGRVMVSSQEWAACTEDGMELRKGDRVLVKKIEGVRLIVEII